MPTSEPESRPPTPASRLRQWLDAAVPTDQLIADSLHDRLAELEREVLPLSGRPLGMVLLSSETRLPVLVSLKNYGKRLARRCPDTLAEYQAALALYYAAIASALVFHRQKISSYSHADLEQAFALLLREPWMVGELADLLARARARCQSAPEANAPPSP